MQHTNEFLPNQEKPGLVNCRTTTFARRASCRVFDLARVSDGSSAANSTAKDSCKRNVFQSSINQRFSRLVLQKNSPASRFSWKGPFQTAVKIHFQPQHGAQLDETVYDEAEKGDAPWCGAEVQARRMRTRLNAVYSPGSMPSRNVTKRFQV